MRLLCLWTLYDVRFHEPFLHHKVFWIAHVDACFMCVCVSPWLVCVYDLSVCDCAIEFSVWNLAMSREREWERDGDGQDQWIQNTRKYSVHFRMAARSKTFVFTLCVFRLSSSSCLILGHYMSSSLYHFELSEDDDDSSSNTSRLNFANKIQKRHRKCNRRVI